MCFVNSNSQYSLVLFKQIQDIWGKLNINMAELPLNHWNLNSDIKLLLKNFIIDSNWKGTLKELYLRIIKLLGRPFSVRENFALEKILSKQVESNLINMKEISYHLPGKSLDDIVSQIRKLKLVRKLHLTKLKIPNNPFA